jgi:hypothetical protein
MTDEEQLSALIDGEGAVDAAFVERLIRDEALWQRWQEQHAVRDMLRGHAPGRFDVLRFRAALAAEPVVMVRHRPARALRSVLPSRWWGGLSAVAACAAVVLVASLVLPRESGTSLDSASGGQASVASRELRSVPDPVAGLGRSAAGPAVREVSAGTGVHEYLLAHEPVSGSFLSRGESAFVQPVIATQPGPAVR